MLLGTALAVLPLAQMFTDRGWLVDAWLGMAMVVLPAVALRSRRPAAAWHLLPGLAALVVFVTVRFVPHHAIGGLLPGAGTWKDVSNLATLLRTSMTEDVAPLHSTPAIRLFLTFGLAMLAAFVDLFAVGLGRPALAGVPFLLLFTLSGAVPRHPVGWVLVGMGSVGFLLVLSANAGLELSRWGRQAHRGSASVPISTRFGESGRRIGLITVVLTLIVSALVPIPTDDVIADALHHGGNGTAGSGNGGGVFIDPLAALRGELTRTAPVNLFTVSVSRAGQHEPFYARQQILDVYNGSAWSTRRQRLEHVGQEHAAADRRRQRRARVRRRAGARRALRLTPLRIGATLRIQDSLQEGRSRFYAEITRIREIADLASGPVPLLFLLDELFHGTNSHDRVVGASGVLRALLDRGAIGLITTHDLALTKVADDLAPRAVNVHFDDHFEGGEIQFDYLMKPGPVTRSNAIALMRAVGLDVQSEPNHDDTKVG